MQAPRDHPVYRGVELTPTLAEACGKLRGHRVDIPHRPTIPDARCRGFAQNATPGPLDPDGRTHRLLPMATSEPAAANHVPASRITRSYYVGSSSSDKAVLLGCRQGDKNGRMTLFFGAPTAVGSSYGPRCGAPNLDDRPDPEPGHGLHPWIRLLPAVGVVPAADRPGYQQQHHRRPVDDRLRAHGRAWAAWSTRSPGPAASTRWRRSTARDGEPSWSTYTKAHDWMHGYDVLYPARQALYANFSADGCPTTTATNGPCNNGWNQSAVCTSHGITTLVDDPDLRNEWRECQAMAAHRRMGYPQSQDGIHFYGVLSQSGACAQVGGCSGTNNSRIGREFMICGCARMRTPGNRPSTRSPT